MIIELPDSPEENSDSEIFQLLGDYHFANVEYHTLEWLTNSNILVGGYSWWRRECNFETLVIDEKGEKYRLYDVEKMKLVSLNLVKPDSVFSNEYQGFLLLKKRPSHHSIELLFSKNQELVAEIVIPDTFRVNVITVNPTTPFLVIGGFETLAIYRFDVEKIMGNIPLVSSLETTDESMHVIDYHNIRQQCIHLLSLDRIEICLQFVIDQKIYDEEIIQQTARINDLNYRNNLGVCAKEEYTLERNKIRLGLINWVNSRVGR